MKDEDCCKPGFQLININDLILCLYDDKELNIGLVLN